jgi:succinate-semialdehyde dehydrogenase / glutarate-semialdehyde dehydrogenase
MFFESVNPYTGKVIKKYKYLNEHKINSVIEHTNAAFLEWKQTSIKHRTDLLKTAAEILVERRKEFGEIMAMEMGKPISVGRGEAEKCAWVCNYYVENAEGFLKDEKIETEAQKSFACFEPLGLIFAVMPWNFPFWQVFRFAAPALMAGNGCLLKHAPNVPECALAIESVFREAGFPKHIFSSMFVDIPLVENIIGHPFVRGVTLTGSERAGTSVAGLAGKYLKKSVMELGGSDPYIVLEDADMELAVETCITSRLVNSGQTCISGKRFIIVKSRLKEFEKLFVEGMSKISFGNPMDDDVKYGPLARYDLRDNLHRQVEESIKMGAKCLFKGEVPSDTHGAFYPAVVLNNVKKGMPAFDEELFGPVAVIVSAENEQDAINIANDTCYGLGAAVFTADTEKGARIAAKELNAGACAVNDLVRSDPRMPFGGINRSGYGCELSYYGMKEFVNIKSVYVK